MQLLFSKKWLPISLLGLLMAIVYILLQDYIAVVWYDEICTSDTSINYVLYGKWDSDVWHHTYNPLYAFLLIGWLKLWGISHAIVCNLNIVLSLVGFWVIEYWMVRENLIRKHSSGLLLLLLYWLGFMLSGLMTKGRIDILGMLMSIILCIFLFEKGEGWGGYFKILSASFLLMLANFYVIPLFVFLFILLISFNYNNVGRKTWFLRGLVTAVGFSLAFASICLFYYKQHFLYHFLSTFISFNGTTSSDFFEKVIRAYSFDIVSLVLLCFLWVQSIIKKEYNRDRILILIFIIFIPLMMVVAGRYALYYLWVFAVPVLILFVSYFDNISNSTFRKIAIILVIFQSLLRPTYWIYERPREYKNRKTVEQFISNSTHIINQYDNVYFRNVNCYYPLVKEQKHVFYLNNDNLKVVDLFVNSSFSSNPLLGGYVEYYPTGMLPSHGIFIATNNNECDSCLLYCQNNSFTCRLLDKEGDKSIYEFKKE